jgi:histone H3/H4
MGDNDILVVVSKMKQYIRDKAGMNTAGAVAGVVSDRIRQLLDQAIENAKNDGRKTVKDRDF